MTAPKETLRLVNNPDRDRYELWSGETFIGLEGYEVAADGVITLQHTIIEERFGRQGYARAMVTLILNDMRQRGQKMVPVCTYVLDYLDRFPEYQDLLAPAYSTQKPPGL